MEIVPGVERPEALALHPDSRGLCTNWPLAWEIRVTKTLDEVRHRLATDATAQRFVPVHSAEPVTFVQARDAVFDLQRETHRVRQRSALRSIELCSRLPCQAEH